MTLDFSFQTYRNLRQALAEDVGRGDVTSRLLIPRSARGRARVIAKAAGIFCGREAARFLFRLADPRLRIHFLIQDGRPFRKGQTLFRITGSWCAILAAERTVLNLLGRLCGIATLTSQFVRRVQPLGVRILDTRKTTPLWRELEKYAVRCGGGSNHRRGLYDAVFVKENHRGFGTLARLKRCAGQFEIEVRNPKELEAALPLRPRVVLFDNYPVSALRKAVRGVRQRDRRVLLEASGGITLRNVTAYARTGVDQISVGALTHSVSCVDLSLLVEHG